MKNLNILLVFALICSISATPFDSNILPEVRMFSSTINFTTTLTAINTMKNQMTVTVNTVLFSTAYSTSACSTQTNYLLNNDGVLYSQFSLISKAVVILIGNPHGINAITTAMNTDTNLLDAIILLRPIVNSPNQSQFSSQLSAIKTLQGQILTEMQSCANGFYMYYSCSDSLATKLCQFGYQGAVLMKNMVDDWGQIVMSDPTKC